MSDRKDLIDAINAKNQRIADLEQRHEYLVEELRELAAEWEDTPSITRNILRRLLDRHTGEQSDE